MSIQTDLAKQSKDPLLSHGHDGNVARKALHPNKLQQLARNVERYDIEDAFRIRLTFEWSYMRRRQKLYAAAGAELRVAPPRKPRVLFKLLSKCFLWPIPEYIISPSADHMKLMAVDKAFASFVAAAQRLRAAVPGMQHYEAVITYMEPRLPALEEARSAATLI